uniref:SAM-dependent methyltransferase Erg6/SMT-type domain-containing protein n=1 Tax=Populus trichocarpa TaxID=3694 RepID=A0A3N7G2F9_POPTR
MAGVDKTCNYVKADFMKMPFSDNTFDAIFAIEATCHAPDVHDCYKEIYRVLKPGQCFAAYEWCITESFDPLNQEHQRIKGEVELGNGLPDIRSMGECLEALQLAGFEVVWEKDVAVASPLPWYFPLDKNQFSLSSFRVTAVGRFITRNMRVAKEFRLSWRKQQMHLLLLKAEGWESSHLCTFSSLGSLFCRPNKT